MELAILITFIIVLLIAIALGEMTIEYFRTMWLYKNRKKDGSEDKNFVYFD